MNINFSQFPQLSTERLLLRSLKQTDVGEIFALRSDDVINQYLDRPKANTVEDAHLFIQQIINIVANNKCIYWAITLKPETTLAGTICLWNINNETSEAEVGYELLRNYQGKGIMQEAIKRVLNFGFEQIRFETIVACVHKENLSSIKLLQKSNFMLSEDGKAIDNMHAYKLSAAMFRASC